jgi:hypothetical protein
MITATELLNFLTKAQKRQELIARLTDEEKDFLGVK